MPSSNLATGNGQSGGNNNYQYTCNFAGGLNSQTPILDLVPPHSHNIDDPGHFHNFQGIINEPLFVPEGDFSIPLPNTKVNPIFGPSQIQTQSATTGIVVFNFGTSIQEGDAVSGLFGVNLSSPYTATFFFICYNSN